MTHGQGEHDHILYDFRNLHLCFKVTQIQTWVDITKKEYSQENGPYKREISVQGKWRR